MTLIGIVVAAMLLVVVVGTIVDIFRRHYSGAATAGWVALVIILPFVGAVIYWVARKPEPVDAENLYRLEADQRHQAARRPYDSSGTGP
jgi:Phospholipase_D-nuclease N-terminal